MEMTTTTNPADVANRLQIYFSKKLLAHAVPTLRLSEFAQKAELPQKASTKQIRFFRKRKPKTADVITLTEGVAPTNYTEIDLEKVDVDLAQYGELTKLSDVMSLIDAYEPLQMGIESMGEDAALHADTIVRNAIVLGMNDADNYHERFAGITQSGDSSADFATMDALTAAEAKNTRATMLGAATKLKTVPAPRISGNYVAVIPPEVSHDMTQDKDWMEASKYSAVHQLFKGEMGMLDGIRYVEANNPFIELNTYKTFDATGGVYSTFVLGRDAFGCPKLAGTSSPWAPGVAVLNKADKTDPLNQYTLAGWKIFFAGILLNKEFNCLVRSKSTFEG